MKRYTVRWEIEGVEALTPAEAALIGAYIISTKLQPGQHPEFTVIAEDGHTSLVKVGE